MNKFFPSRISRRRTLKTMISIVLFTVFVSACVYIPEGVRERTVYSHIEKYDDQETVCYPGSAEHVVTSSSSGNFTNVLPEQFNFLNWNVYKGKSQRWFDEFSSNANNQDIITLQEAFLTEDFRDILNQSELHWNLAVTFRHQYETGVMTLSQVTPESTCVQRTLEPWLLLPKSTLFSSYKLENSNLLVVNIHVVNFSLGMVAFKSQLNQLAFILKQHEGPIILAGDFNTWHKYRNRSLENILKPLLLKKVYFKPENIKSIFENPLDFIYYRDLQVITSKAGNSLVSDHNPMWVTFKQIKVKNEQ